jgi:FHA domain-containing protein
LPVETLTPEFMKLIGQLLHEAMRGTVDLLVARAGAQARSARRGDDDRRQGKQPAQVLAVGRRRDQPPAEPTRRAASCPPTGRCAMPTTTCARTSSRSSPACARRSRGAQALRPAVLEGKLTKKSVIGGLLPGSRKARLWEVFQDLYGEISAEASDDFHELFGKEFLRAYESHIEQLSREPR